MIIKMFGMLMAAAVLVFPGRAWAHCEIPCGIYDDELKFKELGQHVDTIEKSVREIGMLEASEKPDMNQLVRWVNNKDEHADRIKDEVVNYFLSQRVKFPGEKKDQEQYDRQLELLHKITVYAMRSKQTVDPGVVRHLREALEDFRELYWKIHGPEHTPVEGKDLQPEKKENNEETLSVEARGRGAEGPGPA